MQCRTLFCVIFFFLQQINIENKTMPELCKCRFVVTDKYYICFVKTWVTVLKVELDENSQCYNLCKTLRILI